MTALCIVMLGKHRFNMNGDDNQPLTDEQISYLRRRGYKVVIKGYGTTIPPSDASFKCFYGS